jgi:hypothetical protein
MKVEYKRKWVAELRSGNHKQAVGRLTRIDEEGNKSHCCLGLLCDIVKDELGLAVRDDESGIVWYNEESGVLPPVVQDAVGLKETSAGVPTYEFSLDPTRETIFDPADEFIGELKVECFHLASLNDDGLTFDQIADIIEWAEPED